VGRRHADVDKSDIRARVADGGEECVRVANLGDDVEPVLREHLGHPFADERGIVGDHDPHGISALIVVARPGRLSIASSRPISTRFATLQSSHTVR
jgi:hypothetical protein